MIVRRLRHGHLEPAEADRLLAEAEASSLTYDHVGSTLEPWAWPHRSPHSECRRLGHGRDVYEIAARHLRAWAPQRHIGATVVPAGAPIETGTTVLVVARLGMAAIVVPNRVVGVIDDADRSGFAYGSLGGHPERGEEAFVVSIDDGGVVTATVTVDAVPAGGLATLAAPFTYGIQRLALKRYLAALAP